MTGRITSLSKGQSTLEMLVALAVVTLSISAAILVSFGNESLAQDARLHQQGLYKAKRFLEEARAQAREDFFLVIGKSVSEDGYVLEVLVSDLDPSTKQVTSRASWQTGGRLQKIELKTIFTNWQEGVVGSTCNVVLAGDWRNPKLRGGLEIGDANQGTELDVYKQKVFLTADSVQASKPDFFVIEVTDPTSPTVLRSLNTGPGLRAVHVAGKYAYLANSSVNAQLQIIDLSNPSNPVLIKSFKLPGVSGSGGGGVGQSIFYHKKRVYLGTTKAVGPEFHIVDVQNPTNPVELGAFETNSLINAIYVQGNLTYLSTPNFEQLRILDVSNPANMIQIGFFTAPGWAVADGRGVDVLGQRVYLGRTVGGFDNPDNHEFFILDATSPSTPAVISSRNLAASVNNILVRPPWGMFATNDPSQEFQVWDIEDLTNPMLAASLDLDATARALDCEGNLIYVVKESTNALSIIGPHQ